MSTSKSMPSAMSRKGTAVSTTSTLAVTDSPADEQSHDSLLNSLKAMTKGVSNKFDVSSLSAVLDFIENQHSLDDRKLLMEHVLALISRLPPSHFASGLNNKFIKLLYNDLPHPVTSYVGKGYAWRTADGSNNNIMLPEMGKAGMPYARSVQQANPLPPQDMPDAGLLFDTLLRRDKFVEHPAGCSSMMFSFAALVIHSVFRTSHTDSSINETSSYVDLSPLYGHNQELQDKVRIKDGRGCIHPDTFAEDRLLLLPPAVCVILVLFSRNHNYIAKKLLEINERKTFKDPSTFDTSDEKQKQKLMDQDEELFQVARLINSNWFATIVFSDYLSSILGMVRQGSSWILNPFEEMRNDDNSLFERGTGNVCSVEFNSLYRWHATTSQNDEKWTENLHNQIFPGIGYDDITMADFGAAKHRMHSMVNDLTHWSLGLGPNSIRRQEDGTFNDEDLARILKNATDDPAGAFKARGTPACMRLHEILGIEMTRRQGVCNLNDFRKFIGLKPFDSFKEWNSDPKVYEVAEKMYGHINNLELYVGLQAEEAKPVVPGAGLCPGYTISRAILSDAVALIRGDRFFTTDRTPYNLTAWGFADSDRRPDGAGFGGALGRLFLRHLPGQFTHDSVYTWFPMLTPKAMKKFLHELDNKEYSFVRPKEVGRPVLAHVRDPAQVQEVLKSTGVVAPYAERSGKLIKGHGFYTASDSLEQATKDRKDVTDALAGPSGSPDHIGTFFYETTCELIRKNSVPLIKRDSAVVDLVRDVLRVVPVVWAAEEVAGISITKPGHAGTYTAEELFTKLSNIYTYIFLEVDTSLLLKLELQTKADVHELLGHIKSNFSFLGEKRRSVMGSINRVFSQSSKSKAGNHHSEIAKRLHRLTRSADQLANTILAIMVGSTCEMTLALTNMVNAALGPNAESSFKSTDLKAGADFAERAMVTDPPFAGVYRAGKITNDGAVDTHERLFLDILAANSQIPSGGKSLHVGTLYSCLGEDMTHNIMANVLRAVNSFTDVRRANGASGKLPSFEVQTEPMFRHAYLKEGKMFSPWPTSLSIQYTTAAAKSG